MVELTWNRNPIPESRPTKIKSMAPPIAPPTPQSQAPETTFEPCASTASLFLYAQGSVINCLHHDTLALERKFDHHKADISFISVDNVSERGAGRLVASYDQGQTTIVWDLFTGAELARFAAFEHLRVAAWMRNGNVAFGNGKGDVVLFEPSTSEHVSTRTIFDPITALAPASDCRTYAIGYQNGSILIATLHPTFTILHTMSTSRGPSPIVSLAWHASSSKQKSDMLATLSFNGDLRVWSVAKPPGKEAPRVIRFLKRSDPSSSEPKWMAWSKNGRIVQYLDGETWAWDVRTKHVTYEPIPTIDNPRGFASYGPTATLFTLGPNHTVQQYDLENPGMVANVQHLPPRPLSTASAERSGRVLQDAPDLREQGPLYGSRHAPFDQSGIDAVRQQRAEIGSPASSRSHANSVSSKASSGKYRVVPFSPPSRSGQTGTSFSITSASGRETPQPSGASYAYASSVSMSSVKSSRAGSRLRNEVHLSPAEQRVDLFPFTRARLNDVPYRSHRPLDETHLTPDDLRRQMLSVVFGWDGDIHDLIKDELFRHPPSSHSAILLAQWLGRSDTDETASMIDAGPASLTDWMLVALSQMTGESQANKVGQAFAQKLLEVGDIHTSATILLGLGDKNEAIEVYVSQNYYMEAILMTCLLTPADWQRQSYLVRRWGEHVVSHAQQQLAIRCFMCTGVEPSDPWMSPAAQQATSFAEMISGRSPMTSPEPRPPSQGSNFLRANSQPKVPANNRPNLKTPALKLITSFDPQPNKFRFPGLKSDDRTPTNAPGVTPIAESAVGGSAISPGGLGSYRANNIQSLNNAMNARTGTPAFTRRRLASIGETPVDVHPPSFPPHGISKSTEYVSSAEQANGHQDESQRQDEDLGPSLLSSARYDPDKDSYKPSPQTAVQDHADQFASIKGLPSPAPGVFEALKERSDSRNGSRDRKPDGLQLNLYQSDASDSGMLGPPSSTMANVRSPASTLNSYNSAKSPSVSGRSIDQYISSLDEANYHSRKYTRGRRNTDDNASQTSARRITSRTTSQDTTRGQNERRYIQPAKRSPSSPVPMSPGEIAQYSRSTGTKAPASKSRTGSRVRKPRSRHSSERRGNRSTSRKPTSRVAADKNDAYRGRSVDRQSSGDRSPSSPLPMSQADDALRLVTSDRERLRSRQRSSSRRPDKVAGSRRDGSPDSRHSRATSRTRQGHESNTNMDTLAADSSAQISIHAHEVAPEPQEIYIEAQNASNATLPIPGLIDRRRKELAAAELEARRLSLARNPSAPNIPFPGELQRVRSPPSSPPVTRNSINQRTPARRRASMSKGSPEYPSSSDSGSSRSGGPMGLPATPKAMRHPKYPNGYEESVSSVPSVPDSFLTLSDARYQGEAEKIVRSMSVPVPEHQPGPMPMDLPTHPRFNPHLPQSRSTSKNRSTGHHRESSRELAAGTYGSSPVAISIEETNEDGTVLREFEHPPILPELQHLNNTPPPPPPAPSVPLAPVSPRASSGTIDIAIDNENLGQLLPRSMTAAPTIGSEMHHIIERRPTSLEHRRGKSINESFSHKIRNLTRMRSNSRGLDAWGSPSESALPYESLQTSQSRI
ncbi:WD40 repeat domain-containing protein [Aspergillus clavatus NRRL 1]|uniref:WD domain protein n=1 Tax=Aspergillus clavatus (strain ATCC 1007 / CBS 513.65 / DSM 816 / NCTC 3887 / NRRL 1 / QM 1276 / 107) TaxID=344612 RepID=A1CBY1_ASPCL|nr:WD domain protein [Aspergillus clavatus NRRL 1]EAW13249.1 WD domain protein [Aspergillus clavatus NRRL 1]